jgi:tetratricopeptide (TPR) repeat protein
MIMAIWLRGLLVVLAAVIGASAIWTISIELLRPKLGYFPSTQSEADQFDVAKDAAARAAAIGVMRGDLWASAAVSAAARAMFSGPQLGGASNASYAGALELAQRAAQLSPHDSRLWLVLADLRSLARPLSPDTSEALKLSYYTNPNDYDLAPRRLSVAARLSPDQELQDAMQAEIQAIILKRPDLRDAIAAAYKDANGLSRQVFEATLEDVDPAFLAVIRAAKPAS